MSKRKNEPKRLALNHDADGITAHEAVYMDGAAVRLFTVAADGFEKLVGMMVRGAWSWVHKDFRV